MANITGNAGNNILAGTHLDDLMLGLDGNDILWGNAGFDEMYGGAGNDILEGGENSDYIWGGDDNDIVFGGTGSDIIYGDSQGQSGGSSQEITTSNTVSIPSSGQDFSVSLIAPDASSASSYSISGFVSTTAVTSSDVNIALVVDVSGSTGWSYSGTPVGDQNGDGVSDSVLDAEIAGSVSLINSIIDAGFGNAMINLITFDDSLQQSITMQANADTNNNGILDLEEALRNLDDLGGTNFEPPLQEAITFFNSRPAGGSNYVFFLSDGVPSSTTNYADEVTTLIDPAGINAEIQAFPIGTGASEQSLDLLDDGIDNNSATPVADPGALSAAITGGGITAADVAEVRVFVNGVLKQTIPSSALTATPFGLRYEVDLTGLSTTDPETIRVVAVATDGASTIVATSQVVESLSVDGDDILHGGDGSDQIFGEGGNDLIFSGAASDKAYGGVGFDTMFGGEGDDILDGGDNGDKIYGGTGFDTVYAGAGNDTVHGGNGRDLTFLGAGADVFFDNEQAGTLGQDTVYAGGGNDTIQGGNGNDVFYGELGNDKIFGRLGADKLFGGDGFDTLDSGDGNDTVDGGNGRDVAYMGNGNDLYLDNAQGGTFGQDTVYGGNGNDTIQGGAGDDLFFGGDGNDRIIGRLGDDTLTGGNGADTFVFTTGFEADTVQDYETGIDTLQLDSGLWSGTLTAAQVVSSFATDTGTDVVFDFGGGNIITLVDVATTTGLEGDILIV